MNNFLDKLTANNKLAILFLTGLSLFFFAGLGLVHLFDWDEINFAESAREMITTSDYMRVQINYIPFWGETAILLLASGFIDETIWDQ